MRICCCRQSMLDLPQHIANLNYFLLRDMKRCKVKKVLVGAQGNSHIAHVPLKLPNSIFQYLEFQSLKNACAAKRESMACNSTKYISPIYYKRLIRKFPYLVIFGSITLRYQDALEQKGLKILNKMYAAEECLHPFVLNKGLDSNRQVTIIT